MPTKIIAGRPVTIGHRIPNPARADAGRVIRATLLRNIRDQQRELERQRRALQETPSRGERAFTWGCAALLCLILAWDRAPAPGPAQQAVAQAEVRP